MTCRYLLFCFRVTLQHDPPLALLLHTHLHMLSLPSLMHLLSYCIIIPFYLLAHGLVVCIIDGTAVILSMPIK